MYVFVDTLRRTLEYNNLAVQQVINITDVGHLSGDNEGDADFGEDRMTKGLKREGMELSLENMRVLGEQYTKEFLRDINLLNVQTAETQFPRASDYVEADIRLIETLMEKGYAYTISDGIYFDTSAYPDYGKLGGIDVGRLKEGARVSPNKEKRSASDFALWKLNDKIGWDAPWGKGFPGWHIECSTMSRTLLGEQVDIHTGGVEHIPVHHNNEIAQSEAASGKKPFARFWLHRAHIQIEGRKIAKSEGSVVYLSDIIKKGFHPLAYRYLLLGAHYRTPMNFSWDALEGAQHALERLHHLYDFFSRANDDFEEGVLLSASSYRSRFHVCINDDLDTPGALGVLWEMVRNNDVSVKERADALADFDRVLGLRLGSGEFSAALPVDQLPAHVQALVSEREEARKNNNWKQADILRKNIENEGYAIKDTSDGPVVVKKLRRGASAI
jgi:cysteinyl-tRNA synthetase